MGFTELRKLYDQGQTEEVLKQIAAMNSTPNHPSYDDLTVLKGWCHYRRKEYKDAHDAAVVVWSHKWGRELMVYLNAYAPGYANDEGLMHIAEELGEENINVANALVIRARASDCSLPMHEDVAHYAEAFRNAREGVHVANLFHNAGRFFLDKARNDDDLRQAVAYLNQALVLYGADANWHHRAAANHWRSVTFEKLGDRNGAAAAAQVAQRFWEKQVSLDPTNTVFVEKSDAAKQRVAQLLASVSV